jgi:hypothetical protein
VLKGRGGNQGTNGPSEWGNDNLRARRRGWLGLEIALLIASGLSALAVYWVKVMPLSSSPTSPPPGVAIAWAGAQLRGYTEANYIKADRCDEPVRVVIDLYRTGAAPESEYPQTFMSGRVAFAITGSTDIDPRKTRIWESQPTQGVGYELLFGPQKRLPTPQSFRAKIRSNAATGERESLTFIFPWNPAAKPDIDIAFEADWLSPRTPGISCWLTVPSQLGEGAKAVPLANEAIGHSEWSRGPKGLPLFNAVNYVNNDGDGRLIVNSGISVPTPSGIEPAEWDCGGSNFKASSCGAVAALEPPDGEASRSGGLVIWSTIGGLMLSICAAAIVASIRELVLARSRG